MSKLLVIGCGGVAAVAIQKCCQNSKVFTELCLASRTKSKCDELKAKLAGKTSTVITTAQVDADSVEAVKALIESYQPDAVLNVALPYQDLTIMDACLACGVHYIDTANYEPEDTEDPKWRAIYEKRCKELGFSAYFDYSWQWDYDQKFKEAGLTALLGTGFDPGSPACSRLMPSNTTLTASIQSISLIAMAVITAIHLQPISTRKSICAKSALRAVIGRTGTG